MNFLAHIYLSGDNDLVKIGNFMADGIRGKQFENYPPEIKKGILLHRFIDTYTDAHPVFRKSTKRLHPNYHHYAGVIVDIFYDHFLAKNWTRYSEESLADFTIRFYQSLQENFEILSPKTQAMAPHLITHNWLLNYQTIEGISQILTQMDSRTQNISKMRFASTELITYYTEFEQEFATFFDDLIVQTRKKLILL